MGNDVEPTSVESNVFWDPERFAPDDIEAVRPDGVRIRPVMQVGGRRLASRNRFPRERRSSDTVRSCGLCVPAALLARSIEAPVLTALPH